MIPLKIRLRLVGPSSLALKVLQQDEDTRGVEIVHKHGGMRIESRSLPDIDRSSIFLRGSMTQFDHRESTPINLGTTPYQRAEHIAKVRALVASYNASIGHPEEPGVEVVSEDGTPIGPVRQWTRVCPADGVWTWVSYFAESASQARSVCDLLSPSLYFATLARPHEDAWFLPWQEGGCRAGLPPLPAEAVLERPDGRKPEGTPNPAWLIEQVQRKGPYDPMWWIGRNKWSRDANDAMRFATEEAAMLHATDHCADANGWKITEHEFVYTPPTPVPETAQGVLPRPIGLRSDEPIAAQLDSIVAANANDALHEHQPPPHPLAARLASLVTADGVPIVPGMDVWYLAPRDDHITRERVSTVHIDGSGTISGDQDLKF